MCATHVTPCFKTGLTQFPSEKKYFSWLEFPKYSALSKTIYFIVFQQLSDLEYEMDGSFTK